MVLLGSMCGPGLKCLQPTHKARAPRPMECHCAVVPAPSWFPK